MDLLHASIEDADEILNLQKLAYLSEAQIYSDFGIEPLQQNIEEKRAEISECLVLKLCHEGQVIGSVRGYSKEGTCYIGKLVVHPNFQGQGFGSQLMRAIEDSFTNVERFELFTGCRSKRNLHLYQKLGYKIFDERSINDNLSLIYLEKERRYT